MRARIKRLMTATSASILAMSLGMGHASAGLFNTLVPDTLNTYEDQNRESIVDVDGDGTLSPGDIAIGFVHLNNRTIPAGVELGPMELYVVFTLETVAVESVDFVLNGVPVRSYIITIGAPASGGPLSLDSLVALPALSPDGVPIAAVFSDIGFDLVISNPGNFDGLGGVNILDFLAAISATGDLDLVVGTREDDDFWQFTVSSVPIALDPFADLLRLGMLTDANGFPGETTASFGAGLSILFSAGGPFAEQAVFNFNPNTMGPTLHDLVVVNGNLSGATDLLHGLPISVPPEPDDTPFTAFSVEVSDLACGGPDGPDCNFFGLSSNADFSLFPLTAGPAIDIEKFTNGVDADDPAAGDAPTIGIGNLVMWEYKVTNTGNVDLVNVVVVDDQGVPVACPQDMLAVGEMMTCTAAALAVDLNNTTFTTVPGLCEGFPDTPLYENMGTATGETTTGDDVEDVNPSHYCNPPMPAIDIEKFTNTVDADDPGAGDAPAIGIGNLVMWEYKVTNTGNVDLVNVVVVDDQGVPVACPQNTLTIGEMMTCTASAFAEDLNNTTFTTVPGLCGVFPQTPLYENKGTVTGMAVTGDPVQDEDPSHYCNPQVPDIDIEKSTNGEDADNPDDGDAPAIGVGNLVMWEYKVTNTGNVNLINVVVVDDQGVAVSCPQDTLTVGEMMTCTASGFAEDLDNTTFTTVPGLCGVFPQTPLYENKGTANGEAVVTGDLVQDVDPSHYCNPQEPDIDIEKSTNGVDADNPNGGDAPQIPPNGMVNWTYKVTNTGDVDLVNVIVVDDQGVAVSCPQDTLTVGEMMTCTASGVAEDLDSTTFTTVPGLCGGFPQTPLYENNGNVTGEAVITGEVVQDVDPSHYCNPQEPAIDIEKSTNGVNADNPNAGDAPQISPGEIVSWTYKVTNTGDVTLLNVNVVDDQGVAVSCPQDTLTIGEMMTCTASGFAEDLDNTTFTTVPGLCGGFPQTPLYENKGTATGETVTGEFVQDFDPSHYCNPQAPAIDIEKETNGVDADNPNAGDAPQISPGGPVSWTYKVTNTGDVNLLNVNVADDQGVAVSCPQSALTPGEMMTCTASGFAEDLDSTTFTTVPGVCGGVPQRPLYENKGTATGQAVTGELVEDIDPSHYCNPPQFCQLILEKTVEPDEFDCEGMVESNDGDKDKDADMGKDKDTDTGKDDDNGVDTYAGKDKDVDMPDSGKDKDSDVPPDGPPGECKRPVNGPSDTGKDKDHDTPDSAKDKDSDAGVPPSGGKDKDMDDTSKDKDVDTGKDGDNPDPSCPVDPVTYTYKLTNNGGALAMVVLFDDQFGEIATFDLLPGEGAMETVTVDECVVTTTKNIATASGELTATGKVCEAMDMATVTVNVIPTDGEPGDKDADMGKDKDHDSGKDADEADKDKDHDGDGGGMVGDEFNTVSYDNDDGTELWSTSWMEVDGHNASDPDGDGTPEGSGNVQVDNGELSLDDNPNTGGQPSVEREVDLSGYADATLRFDFFTTSTVDASDAVVVEVSDNGGSSYTVLETFSGISGAVSGSRSYDISGFISNATRVRFRVTNLYGGSGEHFMVDNVQIASY